MIKIFKNSKYDFVGKSKYFTVLSLVICLLGCIAFFTKGFNFGIDFTGGTLLNVRFNKPVDIANIRQAIAKQGLDPSKVIIQPLGKQLGEESNNEVLIRMPQTLDNENIEGGIDKDKTAIIEALSKFHSDVPENKTDINTSSKEIILSVLLAKDPMGYLKNMEASAKQEYEKIAQTIVSFRDEQSGGIISSFTEIVGLSDQLYKVLPELFYIGDFNIVNAEVVGPQIGEDLRNRAIYVTLAALLGMLVYIGYRFEWIYGLAAVMAVFHDVIVTLTCFCIFGWEIDLTVIAALLTLIGYSMNDTIVIFDRMRDLLKKKRQADIVEITNLSINETLARTFITAGLIFMAVLALLLFGGPVLKGFSLALFIGVIVGAYSTLGIAKAPIILWWKRKQPATA